MNWRRWIIAMASVALVACSGSNEQTPDEAQAAQQATSQEAAAEEEAETAGRAAAQATTESARAKKGEHDESHGPRGHRFTEPEKYAKRWNDPGRDSWQKPQEVMAILGVEKDMTVVDLGTGTGYFVPHLAKTVGPNGKVLALDVEEPMVEYVKNRVLSQDMDQVEARVVATDDPGLAAESIDRVLTVNTWHHIKNRGEYAQKLAEALKPGGAVAVVDYTLEGGHGPPRSHKLSPEQVKEELEAGGLNAQVVEENLPRQYIVIGRKLAE